MTLRELTSGFAFWSRGYLRMAVMHLPVKFGADIFIQSGVINIFPKFKMAVIFRLYKFGHSGMLTVWYWCAVPNLVQISVIVTHLSFRPSFDGVTRINLRFRLLVTWSSPQGCGASSHKIWSRYLYLIRSYWHFPEIKDSGCRHLGFVGEPWDHPRRRVRGPYSL